MNWLSLVRFSIIANSSSVSDPMRIGGLWQEMYRSQYFEGGRYLDPPLSLRLTSHFTISQARRSACRSTNCSAGNSGISYPCFATTFAESLEKLIEDTNLLIENGWNVIRTAPVQDSDPTIFEPRESIAITASQLTQLREAVGSCARPRYRLPPSSECRGSRIFLPAYAQRHPRLP